MIRAVLAAALPILLGGCTTLYPPLYSSPSVASTVANQTDALVVKCKTDDNSPGQTLACAEILQDIYSTGYQTSAKWQDVSQLPIIGAAAAAAWILLKDKENAARKVGKIGIGALAYSAGRDQLFPKDMPVTFIKGHAALGCVVSLGEYFDGDRAEAYSKGLENELVLAYALRVAVQKLRYLDPVAGDTSASPEMLAAARTLADQSITLSATQLEASQAQLGAYQFANAPFRAAVTNIAAWVASRGRASRPNQTYDALLGTFKPKPPTTRELLENSDPTSPDVDPDERQLLLDMTNVSWKGSELVERLATASSVLTNAAIRLKGATPDYKARLDAVTKCADIPTT